MRDLLFEEKPLVDSFAKTVHGAVVFAHNVQSTVSHDKPGEASPWNKLTQCAYSSTTSKTTLNSSSGGPPP